MIGPAALRLAPSVATTALAAAQILTFRFALMTVVRTLIVAAMLLSSGNTQSPSRPFELAVVTGTVREPDGSSVSGAKVELRRPSDRANAIKSPSRIPTAVSESKAYRQGRTTSA
jgi:hypothetical protein